MALPVPEPEVLLPVFALALVELATGNPTGVVDVEGADVFDNKKKAQIPSPKNRMMAMMIRILVFILF
jgi:hypothetical protein